MFGVQVHLDYLNIQQKYYIFKDVINFHQEIISGLLREMEKYQYGELTVLMNQVYKIHKVINFFKIFLGKSYVV